MCGYFCIGFIDFMFVGRSLIDFTSLFSPYDFKKNDDIILHELIFNISLFKNRIIYTSFVFILNTQVIAILKYIFLGSNFGMHFLREEQYCDFFLKCIF